MNDVFGLFVFEVDFVLKIKGNLCLFALSWTEMKHETKERLTKRVHLLLFIKCVKKNLLKGK